MGMIEVVAWVLALADYPVSPPAGSPPPFPLGYSNSTSVLAGSSPAISTSFSPSFILDATLSLTNFFGGISGFAQDSPQSVPTVVE